MSINSPAFRRKYRLVVFSSCENNNGRSTMRLKENITKSQKNITSRFTIKMEFDDVSW